MLREKAVGSGERQTADGRRQTAEGKKEKGKGQRWNAAKQLRENQRPETEDHSPTSGLYALIYQIASLSTLSTLSAPSTRIFIPQRTLSTC
jgi:hypothetical protein